MMKRVLIVISLIGFWGWSGLAFAQSALVSPSQPHAVISTGLPASTHWYAVKILTIDGQLMPLHANRQDYWVSPGRHTISFQVVMNSLTGGPGIWPSGMRGPEHRRSLTLRLRRGWEYFFGAKVEHSEASTWKPFLIMKKRLSGSRMKP